MSVKILEKMSDEERRKTIELAVLFLLKCNGVCVDEEMGCAYFQCDRENVDDDTLNALSILCEVI